jgi:hypothetical protein
MEKEKLLIYTVYFNDFQIVDESTVDVIDYLNDETCPICGAQHPEWGEVPVPEKTGRFYCDNCTLTVSVSAFWTD